VKFALISNVLPPSHSAHAAILFRLLRDRDPESYCVLSSRDYGEGDIAYTDRLPARYYHLGPRRSGLAGRTATIAKILRREGCEAVVGCTGGDRVVDFAAAYLASRLTKKRFYAYLLDQFSHMVDFGLGRSFLRHLEPAIMRNAAAVIVPNEFLAEEIRARFAIDPVLIRNACDLSVYEHANGASGDRTRIVYTGQVGVLHFGAFRNLLAAIEPTRGKDVLHLYVNQSPQALEAVGIEGPVVFHPWEPLAEMPAVQTAADILFLPLGIASPYERIVRTAAPGKIGEYLAARRPILVHAPADSFVAWYFRRHECGLVVDRDDPGELAAALDRLRADRELAQRLSERAWERAQADFRVEDARARLDAVLAA
jgi:glycosyltransferase involved in cell wall biosynthesis